MDRGEVIRIFYGGGFYFPPFEKSSNTLKPKVFFFRTDFYSHFEQSTGNTTCHSILKSLRGWPLFAFYLSHLTSSSSNQTTGWLSFPSWYSWLIFCVFLFHFYSKLQARRYFVRSYSGHSRNQDKQNSFSYV